MKVLSLAFCLLYALLPVDALAGDWIVWRASQIGSYPAKWSPQTEFPSREECDRAKQQFVTAAVELLEANQADYSQVEVSKVGKIAARLTRPMPRLNESMPLIYPSLFVWFECWPAGTQPGR